MHVTVGRVLAAGAAILAVAAPAAAGPASAGAAQVTGFSRAAAGAARVIGTGRAAASSALGARHVVLVGIGGLRWNDLLPAATPVLWRLAGEGSAGSLVVSGIRPRACVPAAALPLVLPLVAVILSSLPAADQGSPVIVEGASVLMPDRAGGGIE